MAMTRRSPTAGSVERRPRDNKKRRGAAYRPDRARRLAVDALEDRLTPSTFTPNSFADLATVGQTTLLATDVNGSGQIVSRGNVITLRSAVIASDKAGGSNTINLSAGTYLLAITPPAGTNGVNATSGDLAVTSALTVSGQGSASTIVEAGTSPTNGISKVFSFNPLGSLNGFAVSLNGLTIQNGKNNSTDINGDGEGGAFDFDAGLNGAGSLTMNDVVVDHNSTINGDGGGVALFDGGAISIANSKITNNIATSGTATALGGGLFIGFSTKPITASTKVAFMSSTISGNATTAADGGGVFSFANFPVAFHDTKILTNQTGASQPSNGGGVANQGSGSFTIDKGSTISGNTASKWGGGIFSSGPMTISGSTITNNSATGGIGAGGVSEGGGGIFADKAAAIITATNSRIAGNIAIVGGSQLDGDGGASSGGVLNAANNWFGTNTPTASLFGLGVKTLTTAPFLKMTFNATPTTLASGGSSALTTAITTNSVGGSGFSAPDGTPVAFAATSGLVIPTSTVTSGGSASANYTAGSPGSPSVSATIDGQTLSINLNVTAGTPTADPQSVNVSFNTAKFIRLTGSDPDAPRLPLTFTVTTSPSHGTLSGTAPNLIYTPISGYHGADAFTFKVDNGFNSSAPATVSLTVAVGTPTANAQSVNVAFNTAQAITLTGSDPDVPPLALTYSTSTASHGVLSGTAPNLTYTPNAGYHGADSFTFTVSNGSNTSTPATVSIAVGVGTPTANAQSANVAFNTATPITLTGSDPDVPPLTLTYAATAAAHGVVSGSAPNLTYTPNAGYQGADSFTFTVNNGFNTSTPATVSIVVGIGTPTANAQSVSVGFNTAKAVTLTGSDPDVPPLPLTYAASAAAHGVLSGSAPNLIYTPNAGFQGADSFTFTASNGFNTSPPATVVINVAAGVPTANAQSVSVGFNTAKAITLTGSDPDAPPLSLTFAASTAAHGVLTGLAPNLTYTPNAGFHGADSFTFTASNGFNTSAPATVTINVAAGVPTASAQSVSVAFNTAKGITLTGTDPDAPPLPLTFVASAASHGVLTGTAPNVTYTPNAGFQGADSFTFTVNNGVNTSAPATVTINVAAGIPVANPQSVNVAFNTATAMFLTGSDPDAPPLPLTFLASTASHGVLTGAAPNLTYTPNAGYHGADSFTFTVNNGFNTSAPATVTINVAAGTPTANPQSVNVPFSTAMAITLTSSDPDVPPLPLTYLVSAPSHGALAGVAPNLTYIPILGYHGPDTFSFVVNNGFNTSQPAVVTINVAAGRPTANSQIANVPFNSAKALVLTGSDPNIPALPLTFAVVAGQGPTHGTISNFNAATGALTYTPNSNYSGPDGFQFTVSNGINTSVAATVSLAVSQPAQATVMAAAIGWGAQTSGPLVTAADGLRLLPTSRVNDIPWYGVNKISITLSQAATLTPADISVTGVAVANYGPVTVSGSGAQTTFTITLARAVTVGDRVTLTIANSAISTYTRELDVLPGDVNDDAVVNSQDAVIIRNKYLGLGPVIIMDVFLDINGDGVIDVNDFNLARKFNGTRLT
jgi:Bacterial Ig domain/Dockerin type I domain